jgi:hypothetical protein
MLPVHFRKSLYLRSLFLVMFLVLLLSACHRKSHYNRSFCYWKTSLDFSKEEDSILKQLQVNHLYVRLFDVDWNAYEQEALPVATLKCNGYTPLPNTGITPAIFITNTVLEKSSKVQVDSLAMRISRKSLKVINEMIRKYAEIESWSIKYKPSGKTGDDSWHFRDSIKQSLATGYRNRIKEIMIDCDWSVQTRENYFYLLKQLQLQLPEFQVSATLRLWQYKYRDKAGIPPVNRCLLMCYSVGSPKDYNIPNSISSVDELRKYLTGPAYPIPTDLALPVFRWGVLFREGKFKGLVSKADIKDYEEDTVNFKVVAPNRLMFKNDLVFENTYMRYGDELKIEQLTSDELEKMAYYLEKQLKPDTSRRITFFSWDTTYIKHYGIENIEKYYRILGH